MMFKCKMCGGDLELTPGSSVAVCKYCGTQQTAPNADNEKKTNLYNRANRLRFSNDFDKAAGVFESIVAEFPDEAEAYWGLCLCKYGIEYVDDWATGRKIPTCHRTSFDSIFSDNNFRMAMEYAYPEAQGLYHAEAKEIDRLQKAIINVAKNEPPYDIFICYKETDDNKQRTKDSVQSQDIYDALTDAGYRVFFARISLEDKLGEEYEPYIFSALMSAKVMLVVGTSFENMNAVWVKNEWGRYLQIMRKERGRVLIPCYSDMDAYDMPQEFRNLQAQDMNKVGFIQDLVRGIGKIIVKSQSQTKLDSIPSSYNSIPASARAQSERKTKEKRRRIRRNIIIVGFIVLVVIAVTILAALVIVEKQKKQVDVVVMENTEVSSYENDAEEVDDISNNDNNERSEVESLMKQGNYKQAYSLLETMGNEYSEEGMECIYQMGIEAYHNGKYDEANEYFVKVSSKSNVSDYMVLCRVHKGNIGDYILQESISKLAAKNFEDAAELMSKFAMYAHISYFLVGNWKTDDGELYFQMKPNGETTYNLPCNNESGTYDLDLTGGVYRINEHDIFKFTVNNANSINVYCFSDGNTYSMDRQ